MEIERTPVDSSNIVSQGYDADSQTLHVEFKSGLYEVKDLPPDKAAEFAEHCSNPSKSGGSYYHKNIRDQYPIVRLN